jgi:hypothetical protein
MDALLHAPLCLVVSEGVAAVACARDAGLVANARGA